MADNPTLGTKDLNVKNFIPLVRLKGWSISTTESGYEPPNRALKINSLGDQGSLTEDGGDGYLMLQSNLNTKAAMWINWKGDLFWSATGDFGSKSSIIAGNTIATKAFFGKVKDAASNAQVVGDQQAAVADSTADATSVSTQLNLLLAALRTHGLIAT